MSDGDDSTTMTDDIARLEEEPCPVCGDELNHIVPNGYRNHWDGSVAQTAICTTEDSDWMYVHVTKTYDPPLMKHSTIDAEFDGDDEGGRR